MNLFKQFGDMAEMVKAAPGLIDQANQLQAQSEQYRQQMDIQAVQAMTADPQPGNLDPIAGVDLDRYARISKGIAAYGYDATKLPAVAAMFGVDEASWASAAAGWAARIQADRGVGRRFNEIYQAV
ncbi:hypothetical protein PX701_02985 [Agromyces sp. H3Y2-19a]|jgi:hypothetical protein|uniref:hypothetical protein n=1 Tax=Agromyces TaxID=33877 RepID=UPI001E4D9047|nr:MULTISPECIES: hypothetical protein [Agromyces]MCD5346209.1 hypothetical protein [Agromyces sp. S2-1-8]MDF0512576.1 hypothetical protein [Agromyces chromiiresistens]